jgi:predicted PurR-regulated permease PerM
VFLGAFVPIIGAVVAGGVALLVALVANGPVAALIVLGIINAIMQLEGHVLQPLLLGRTVKLHPLAVVLAIATGLVIAGIAGVLFAVPLLAVLNSGIRSLRSASDQHVDPDDVHTSARPRPRPGCGRCWKLAPGSPPTSPASRSAADRTRSSKPAG